MKISNTKLRIIFLLTNLAFQSVVGQFGVYSIIKSPMSKSFNYSEQYLGIIDFIQLFGQIIGAILTLFLTTNPIKSFLNFSLFNLLLGIVLLFPQYMIYDYIRDIFILLIFFFHGVVGASVVYSQIIFSLFFDENSKKCQYSIWYSVTFIGEIIAFIVAQNLVYKLKWKWEYVILIWKIYLIVIAIAMKWCIDIDEKKQNQWNQIDQMLISQKDDMGESQYEDNEQDHNIEKYHINHYNNTISIDHHTINQLQQLSQLQKLSLLLNKITTILSNIKLFLLIMSFSLIQGLYTNLLFWLPYYYIITNNQQISTLSILLISLSLAIGGIIAEVVLFQIFNLEYVNKRITYGMLWGSFVCYTVVWLGNMNSLRIQQKDENENYYYYYNITIQLILLIIANFLFACPYSRISSIDPIQQSHNNQHIIKIILLLGNLGRNIINAIFVLIIGYLININKKYFWTIIFVNVLLCLIVQTIRKVKIKKDEDQEEEQGNRQDNLNQYTIKHVQ